MNRQEALKILDDWVKSPNLKKHMLAVAQSMAFYAKYFKEKDSQLANSETSLPLEEKWWIVGLLHDLDYEKYPNPNKDQSGHPYKAVEFLKDKLDQESLDAIMGHAEYTGTLRKTLMAKTLFAVDELTGMITAVALIKPDKKLSSVDVNSVKKRFKEKRFAAGVNREEIIQGASELGIPLDEHIQNVIKAMNEIAAELGL
jgi:predicted hydrolase (HD superfamily)